MITKINKENNSFVLAITLIGAMFGFSAFHLSSSYALKKVSIIELLFFRQLIAFFTLFIYLKITKNNMVEMENIGKKDKIKIMIIGFVGYFLTSLFLLIGNSLTQSLYSAFVNSLFPIFIAIASSIYLKELLSFSQMLAISLGFLGTYIIAGTSFSKDHLLGIIFALVGGISWGIGSVISKKIMGKITPIVITTYGLLTSSIISFPFLVIYWLTTKNISALTFDGFFLTLLVGTVGTAFPYFLWSKALSMADPGTCSLAYPIMPIITTLFFVFVEKQKTSLSFFLGGLIIISGIIIHGIVTRNIHKKKEK
ncbi:MAG: DMT family transporter [Brevefilum fermentans]|uniref:EamA domain-containing protein n=1 Tax=Candidatus Brevifilum fermentans TaxID=1986204 RepID=A0A1Y6K1I3_9CHLR|nr:DMT family transporter [Brevefilum fermentans]SMX53501.1 conserved membrane protein of unknown function [Brevefilum fermentans]